MTVIFLESLDWHVKGSLWDHEPARLARTGMEKVLPEDYGFGLILEL